MQSLQDVVYSRQPVLDHPAGSAERSREVRRSGIRATDRMQLLERRARSASAASRHRAVERHHPSGDRENGLLFEQIGSAFEPASSLGRGLLIRQQLTSQRQQRCAAGDGRWAIPCLGACECMHVERSAAADETGHRVQLPGGRAKLVDLGCGAHAPRDARRRRRSGSCRGVVRRTMR